MGRSLGELNSGANNAKQLGLDESGIVKPSVERFGSGTPNPSKGPSKEDVLQRMIDVTPESGGSGRAFAKDVTPVRKSTIPTVRMGTVAEGQRRAGTKEVSIPFQQMHKDYSSVINSARNLRKNPLTPDQHDALDVATTHLMNSIASYHRARTEGGLGTPDMHNPTAHTHLHDAVKHLTYAHETLVQSGVHDSLLGRRLSSPLPKDEHVAELSAKSSTLEGQGVGGVQGAKKPYKEGVLGRNSRMTNAAGVLTLQHHNAVTGRMDSLEIPHNEIGTLASTFGRNHPAIQKMYAMIGTQRGKRMRVSSDERREGVISSTGAGVAADAPAGINPKKRASGRRIDVEYRTQSNPSNNTGGRPRY
jgi:hypothetical protein